MTDKTFSIYDKIISGIDCEDCIISAFRGERWGIVHTEGRTGIAMNTVGSSIAPIYPNSLTGLTLSQAASGIKSWNFEEATLALAAANAFYNTPENIDKLGLRSSSSAHYTDYVDFRGKSVCMVGHMRSAEELRRIAKEVYIIEREPKPGDYPDSACDYLLPRCDIAVITGSSIINKTLPHLLDLSQNAYTILTGPSVPLCPSLLDCGIDMLAGLALTDRAAIHNHVCEGRHGSPAYCGEGFILSA